MEKRLLNINEIEFINTVPTVHAEQRLGRIFELLLSDNLWDGLSIEHTSPILYNQDSSIGDKI
jgi:hypothetical protein